jgi:uncharacterized secreted protein with C-terminal beta-propeller domain
MKRMKLLCAVLAMLILFGACSATPAPTGPAPERETRPAPDFSNLEILHASTYEFEPLSSMQQLQDLYQNSDYYLNYRLEIAEQSWDDGNALPMPAAEPAMGRAASNDMDASFSGGGNFSQTNTQVSGIDEGDILKTDGEYIYFLSRNYPARVRIVRADGAELRQVSSITLPDTIHISEMYVSGDTMVLVASEYLVPTARIVFEPEYDEPVYDDYTPGIHASSRIYPVPPIGDIGISGRQMTSFMIYDISDRANPVPRRTVSAEGHALATRLSGDVLVFVTNQWHFNRMPVMPFIRDTAEDDELREMPLTSIGILCNQNNSEVFYGAFDINGNEPAVIKSVIGSGSTFYMDAGAFYLSQSNWHDDGSFVSIHKFAVSGTDINYVATGRAEGWLLNQYSMDAHNGFFRAATTAPAGSYVSIFDGQMNMVGRTEPMAEGELIYSVRFMGDMGYVVTFLDVDPLFTIDLSDPSSPRILGELKIPGFSQHLQPVGDGLLVGIGRHTQETFTRDEHGVETVVGHIDRGLKISLFDVSDPFDPLEIDVMLLGEGWTEVSHNPRAMMVDYGRNRFAFTIDSWNNEHRTQGLVFAVENGQLRELAKLPSGNKDSWSSRFCFIGDTLYWAADREITAYDYTSFTLLRTLSFT